MFVISNARKLLLEVPKTTERAFFPEDAKINAYGQNNDTPSIVVRNATDDTWQGASWPNGCIIINQVPDDVANQLLDIYEESGLEATVAKAIELGYDDMYTTPKDTFVDVKLSPAGRMVSKYTGVVKRDDRDLVEVYRQATDGLIRIKPDDWRDIKDDILVATYRNVDGSTIELDKIPVV